MTTRSLVTIDGLDGSGKSELAARLAAALGPRAGVVGVDEFRRAVDWTRGREPDLYYDERYDLPALDRFLGDFLDGASGVTIPFYDGARELIDGHITRSFQDIDQLILEGVFVARVPAAAAARSIWIDVDEAEARRRILARDLRKGRTRAEVTRRIEERYLPAYRRYTIEHAPRERAAIVIENTRAPRLVRGAWPVLERVLEDQTPKAPVG